MIDGMTDGMINLPDTPMMNALAPHGPEATQVATLTQVMTVGGALILLLVCVLTAVAIFGPRSWKRALSGRDTVRWGGFAFPIVALAALLFWSLWLMRATERAAAAPAALAISVVGEQWWWRLGYRDAQGRRFAEANEIVVPVGVDVDLLLESADVIHSVWLPSLAGKLDMIPGRTNRLRLRADRPGVYRGQCAEYCGGSHARMGFELIALAPDDFAAWRAAAHAPRREPADEDARRGREVFAAAGCGACHTVRGTDAQGRVGPDLTRLGARRHIAAASLPNTHDARARFVARSQEVKPQSLMPPFAFLTETQLSDLAAYLGGLK
jgi:cytochrome c oxidase subunit 2